jgi:hypothetical protein
MKTARRLANPYQMTTILLTVPLIPPVQVVLHRLCIALTFLMYLIAHKSTARIVQKFDSPLTREMRLGTPSLIRWLG